MRHWISMVFALGAFSRVSVFFCAAAPASAEPVLTNIVAVLQLSPERASAELPVRVTATVTYADLSGGILFVEEDTGGIFVGTRHTVPALRSGDAVEVEGRSDPGLHLRAIMRASVKSLGRAPREPARPALEEVFAGRFDCRFVELRGVVRHIGENRGRASLQIEAENGQIIEASFLRLKATNLWDATVRVRGVCGLRGMKSGSVLSILLYCANEEALTVEQPGLADAFAVRAQSIAAIAASKDSRRVRVDGRVAEISETGILTVEDSRKERVSVEAQSRSAGIPIRTNDRVNVSGIPVRTDGRLALRYIELRAVAPMRGATTNTSAPPTAPIWTRISQVHRLGEKANRGSPVRIRGSVTYYDGDRMLFVQDESGGIYVYPDQAKLAVRAGQIVEMEGFTGSGLYAPVILAPRFVVLGESEMPEAKPVAVEALWRGQHDSQRVEISGVVFSVTRSDECSARIELSTSTGRIGAFLIVNGDALPTHLVDAEVRLRGVCGSKFNNRRQFTSAQLFVASTNDVIIEQPAPADPFGIAAQPITNLLQFGSSSAHRTKVAGTVTFVDRRQSLLSVQDGSGGVFVHVHPPWVDTNPGDAVEVLGFPTATSHAPELAGATVRIVGSGRNITPRVVRSADALSGKYDGELITLDARLLDRFVRGSNEVLVLKSGEITLEAEKPRVIENDRLTKLERRSILRLTGVCVVHGNQSSAPRAFKLTLRSPDDVVVLSTSRWWNNPVIRIGAGVAGLIFLTPVVWVALLRRKVRQQTAIIRSQLEREQEQNDELEAKVRERTAELSEANKQLVRARDELELRVQERTAELSRANEALRAENAERERSEQALRLSEEQFSKAFRCSPVPMSISSIADGRYMDVNDAYANMLGFSREEMLGRTSVALGIWADLDERLRAMQALREKKTVRDWELELRSKDGDVRHVLASAETVVVNNEDCLIAILNDVTGSRQLEAQLRQSQKMEAVGQLAAGIAHDFNNMLTVIIGHTSLLQAQNDDPEQLNSLAEVADTANRAASLTQQLLTFSRRQPLQPKSVDVNEIIVGTSRMLQRILGEQITLRFQCPASLPGIYADRGMIEQIIMNLAVNARDAMPKGGELKFRNSFRHVDESYVRRIPEARVGAFVCMTISDTGCGMNADTLSRVFEPFFTTKDVGKGTGLGLATVYGIVKQHNGWIEVSSQPGQGTTFDVYLPVENQTVKGNNEPALETATRGGNETILLVEDESGVRDLARDVLCRYGYEVLSAANGSEAIELWQMHGTRIDLLLTDMVMPEGVNGRDLASRLRAEHPKLKVIYTSGYNVAVPGSEGPLRDGLNFLPKPYPARKLATAVRNCLDI